MASFRKINTKAKSEENTGFGTNSSYNAGRFLNKDGKVNIKKTGISLLQRYSLYHIMLELPRWKFLMVIFSFFIVINLAFATIYYSIGMDQLGE